MVPFLHRMTPSTMEENPLWLVVLCDMMTTLMLFFLVMYVMTRQSAATQQKWLRAFDPKGVIDKPVEGAPPQPLREFKEEEAGRAIKELFSEEGLAGTVEIKETRDTIRVSLHNKMLFPTARAELNDDAALPIKLLAQVLNQMPNEVVVEGHTDSVPVTKAAYLSNWELSVARSYSVVARLIGEGVAPRRLVSAGYGEYHPIDTNATRAGRARNRRVEIVILRCPKKAVSNSEFDCLGIPRGQAS